MCSRIIPGNSKRVPATLSQELSTCSPLTPNRDFCEIPQCLRCAAARQNPAKQSHGRRRRRPQQHHHLPGEDKARGAARARTCRGVSHRRIQERERVRWCARGLVYISERWTDELLDFRRLDVAASSSASSSCLVSHTPARSAWIWICRSETGWQWVQWSDWLWVGSTTSAVKVRFQVGGFGGRFFGSLRYCWVEKLGWFFCCNLGFGRYVIVKSWCDLDSYAVD